MQLKLVFAFAVEWSKDEEEEEVKQGGQNGEKEEENQTVIFERGPNN